MGIIHVEFNSIAIYTIKNQYFKRFELRLRSKLYN